MNGSNTLTTRTAYLLLYLREGKLVGASINSSTYSSISRLYDGDLILAEAATADGATFQEAKMNLMAFLREYGASMGFSRVLPLLTEYSPLE